jgi:hypothetical protein
MDRPFPLRNAADAVGHFEAGRAMGKVVIRSRSKDHAVAQPDSAPPSALPLASCAARWSLTALPAAAER